MKGNEKIAGAIETIRKGKGRSTLAIIITALGMGCLLVMMGLGLGGMGQFQKSISGNDATEIRITKGEKGKATLNDTAIESFKKVEGVSGATGVITLPLQIKTSKYEVQSIEATAVDPSVLAGKLDYEKGGLFATQGSTPQLILGYGAQFEFIETTTGEQTQDSSIGGTNPDGEDTQNVEPTPPPIDWLKESLQISIAGGDQGDKEEGTPDASAPALNPNRQYTGHIAGILKKDESDRNGKALMSLAVAKKMLQENYELAASLNLKTDTYASALVYAKDIDGVQAIMDAISAMGYTAESAVADLPGMQAQLGLQQTVLILIEVFTVLMSGLILAYILLTNVKGTAFRASSHTESSRIRQGMLTQSAILGFIGGAVGVLIAYFFCLIVNTSTAETVVLGMHFGQNSNVSIPFWLALVTLVISTVTGFLAGLPPAYRAGKIDDSVK